MKVYYKMQKGRRVMNYYKEKEDYLNRREFLKISGIMTLSLSLSHLSFKTALAESPGTTYPYRSWEDLYRKGWQWDKVVKVSHAFTNCRTSCSFDAYIKDGVVWREEQNATYPQTNPSLQDPNPRGCQKGACFSSLLYAPNRIKYPLKRIGERGEGKWKRVSWDQAISEIAEKFVEVIKEHGSDAIIFDPGATQISLFAGLSMGILYRFPNLIGAVEADGWTDMSDLNYGAILTYGQAHIDGSFDDLFNADYIIMWCYNPVYTQIPDVHYIYEARYHG